MPHEHTRKKEIKKCLRESCYPCIKCTAATFLAAFMWRKLLNSAVLATITHKRPERVSDGSSTQVVALMINKCRIKIIKKELYNVRDPPVWRLRKLEEKRL